MSAIESSARGRRPVSFEPNLVPFIDLMSVLITFLLISAVWTQVSMIQIGSSIYGKRSEGPLTPPPAAEVVLRLDIMPTGLTLVTGSEVNRYPLLANGEMDLPPVMAKLTEFKQKYPQKLDAAVAMADSLAYERLIQAMDVFLKTGFPSISILTGGPGGDSSTRR